MKNFEIIRGYKLSYPNKWQKSILMQIENLEQLGLIRSSKIYIFFENMFRKPFIKFITNK